MRVGERLTLITIMVLKLAHHNFGKFKLSLYGFFIRVLCTSIVVYFYDFRFNNRISVYFKEKIHVCHKMLGHREKMIKRRCDDQAMLWKTCIIIPMN